MVSYVTGQDYLVSEDMSSLCRHCYAVCRNAQPYHLYKLDSFLGANQTKSACLTMAVEGR